MVLSGGASRIDGFAQALEERFAAPVQVFNPFKKILIEADKLGIADLESMAPTAAVAVGLALRKSGDR